MNRSACIKIGLISLILSGYALAANAENCKSLLNYRFTGEWVGFYAGHYDEFVRITVKGDIITATKITGDDFVPADEVTWRANLKTGYGEGQISEREFRNPRFVPGRLKIIDNDHIVFSWMNCGEVEYRRDE